MAVEIERKFLIDFEKIENLEEGFLIKQGYIKTEDLTVVRVRVKEDVAYLTIKSANKGISRLEYDYKIPVDDANEMLEKLCNKPIIEKKRYFYNFQGHIWEIDVFFGDNEGLIVAEVELKAEDEEVVLPSWVKKEVTGDVKYYNSSLLTNPFKNWK